MGLFDDAVPGGNITKPLLVALGALLVGKMIVRRRFARAGARTGASGWRGAQGGFGGLGGLLDKLTNAGHGSTVSSWLGNGQNEPIQPNQLQSALGQTTISDLARQAGISEQELLAQLSQTLPGVVDKLTPNGRVPSQRIQSVWNRA